MTLTHRQKKQLLATVKYLVMTIAALLILFPYIWMVLSSLKAEHEVFQKGLFFPSKWMFSNYTDAWNMAPFERFFMNSIISSAICIIAQLVTCSLAAFAFAKLKFRFKNICFLIFISSMMIPAEATTTSNYITAFSMGLVDTYPGLVITSLTSVFGIFLLRQFFMTVPDALLEAARIDGCGDTRAFMSIFLPMAKGAMATVGIFAFINSWNAYMWPMIITNDTNMRTVQTGIRYMISPDLGSQWAKIMAASAMIILPVMLVFILLQKYFIQGVTKTGIK